MAGTWLEDLLANLQAGAGPMAQPARSPFPDVAPPPPQGQALWDEIEKQQREENAAADRRNVAGMRRGPIVDPFGVPDMNSAGVQLGLGQGPAGTGVPMAMPAGAPDGSAFGAPAPFSIAPPPSLAMAKSMSPPPAETAPPPIPPEAVPMPRPRPAEAPGATDISAVQRAPAAPPVNIVPPAVAAPAEPSFADRARSLAPALLAAGASLQGDNSVGAALMKRQEDQSLAVQNASLTARALVARGAPVEEVMAATRNPDLMKALVGKYFETKPAQVVNGRLVRERADGKVDTLADFSKEEKAKNPVVKDFKLQDGSVVQKQWNPETEAWDPIKGFEKPVPGDRDKRLSVTDISKLSEEGGKLSQINGFQSTFKPEFGGWKSNKIGDIVNEAARNLPESVVGKNAAASAAWWQDYDRYKNVVRHELFGSALTKAESDAFMRADIGPGMTPEQISRNLATQKRVVEGAIRRKAKGLIGSTYDKNAIAAAYGVTPEFIDQEDAPAPGAAVKPGNYVWKDGALVPQ